MTCCCGRPSGVSTRSALDDLGRVHNRADWRAAARFWQQYLDVTVRERPGAFDAAELIGAAIARLESDPDLLARERSRRRHIFVDEYQDTDPAQARLLALLADGAEELVLVGDPDQSIYAFRGADPGGDAPGRRMSSRPAVSPGSPSGRDSCSHSTTRHSRCRRSR